MNKSSENKLNAIIKHAMAGLKPPDILSVSQWADERRMLSAEGSAEPGKWRTYRTPYLKEPMDAFTDPKIRRIVMVACSQVGKSEMELNMIGYIIDEDPGSILFVHPQVIDAREYSKLRVAPMLRDCPTLRDKVGDPRSKDGSNTVLQKSYPGGILTLCGSTEAHALASKPIRYIIGDERDRWATSAGKEGDPWLLAMARQITFYNAKAVEVSTPTIKNHSAIASAFEDGTMERWCVECPHCGAYNDIRFADIRYKAVSVSGARKSGGAAGKGKKQGDRSTKKTMVATDIVYVCKSCGGISTEREIKRQPAKWVAENPDAYSMGVRSFWLNAFHSPWASWESSINEYIMAKGDPSKLQVVYNTRFGELWEDSSGKEDEEGMLKRREVYAAELPDGVLVLTCGVDTQDDRLEYEVVGHGHDGETWGIRKGEIMGRPDSDGVWVTLDVVIGHMYRFASGVGLPVSVTFIDEGGHFTQQVRQRCRARFARHVFAIMGRGGDSVPFTSPPSKQKILVNGEAVGTCWQYKLGVDAGKQIIMDNLRVKKPGVRYCHFPMRDDYGPRYFASLLSERLVYKRTRRSPWAWEKIPGHERNEALDCRNYALAAFETLAKDLDVMDRQIRHMAAKIAATNAVGAAGGGNAKALSGMADAGADANAGGMANVGALHKDMRASQRNASHIISGQTTRKALGQPLGKALGQQLGRAAARRGGVRSGRLAEQRGLGERRIAVDLRKYYDDW
jgi:phage terminase large subunit GpA-like protein